MAMGSLLAPTFASFAMNLIEHKISFLPTEQQPLFYARYVDDVFVVFKNPTDLHSFYDFIKTVEKNL